MNNWWDHLNAWPVGRKHSFVVYHYNDVIMGAITSQITSLTIVYSIVYSDANQRKLRSSASLAFVRAIHRGPVISAHKWPVTRKMFPFDDVIMHWTVSCDDFRHIRSNLPWQKRTSGEICFIQSYRWYLIVLSSDVTGLHNRPWLQRTWLFLAKCCKLAAFIYNYFCLRRTVHRLALMTMLYLNMTSSTIVV